MCFAIFIHVTTSASGIQGTLLCALMVTLVLLAILTDVWQHVPFNVIDGTCSE